MGQLVGHQVVVANVLEGHPVPNGHTASLDTFTVNTYTTADVTYTSIMTPISIKTHLLKSHCSEQQLF